MKIIITESQYKLLSESDSFELYMRRHYSELKEVLFEKLNGITDYCSMRLSMFSNYVRGMVADLYLDRQSRNWFDLYDFLRKVFSEDIKNYYLEKTKDCN
jgi:hypothetical protein